MRPSRDCGSYLNTLSYSEQMDRAWTRCGGLATPVDCRGFLPVYTYLPRFRDTVPNRVVCNPLLIGVAASVNLSVVGPLVRPVDTPICVILFSKSSHGEKGYTLL